jgi:putative ABC transport system substrate-binding protein
MKLYKTVAALVVMCCLASVGHGASKSKPHKNTLIKKRILVVSSYHREYRWSQETHQGFCDAMLKYGYFDSKNQVKKYTKNDYVETKKAIVKKMWMDTKRKKGKQEKVETTARVTKEAKKFKPDFIFLGDDDAAKYIGNQFLDSRIPIVFWGVNNTPVKYGLVDTKERPGHNVTGIYQTGYYKESLLLLKKVVPSVKTFAVLTDDTIAGRSHYKAIEYLARQGALPLKLVETVVTGDYEKFKAKALELQSKVDAFFIAQYSSLRDKSGNYVSAYEIANWYMTHIKIPETAEQGQFVRQGMLCGADDSGYNQGFAAVGVAHDILSKGANPATYATRAPKRGALIVNRQRATMLGIILTKDMGIEEYVEKAAALKKSN